MATPLFRSSYLFGQAYLQRLFAEGELHFALEGELLAIPTDALDNPFLLARLDARLSEGAAIEDLAALSPALASLVQLVQREADAFGAADGVASVYWYRLLYKEAEAAGLLQPGASPLWVEKQRRLPALMESALLVLLLGLEEAGRVPVLALAADHLLMHALAPSARAIGPKGERHEPMAAYLVNVVARALRPWPQTHESRPLTTHERIVLLHLLGELATSKARKLLHEEKKHAHRHPTPELLCRAVNRVLRRWQQRVVALSPSQRIVRAAATFRYLNLVRRHGEPATIDAEVVADIQRATLWR